MGVCISECGRLPFLTRRLPWRGAAFRKATHTAHALGISQQSHPVIYHPDFQLSPLPEDHRFPMPKDHLLYLRLKALGLADMTFTPEYPTPNVLTLVHDEQYVTSFIDGTISAKQMRQIGLPWSETLVKRTLIGTGSAVLAAHKALEHGVACTTNGGTHHAHRAYGTGWCIFNDLAVAARVVQKQQGVGQVLFVDLDVHQGDGTATIFQHDKSVYTFSMHCKEQPFPLVVRESDFDVGLAAGTSDAEYLRILKDILPGLLRRVKPEIVMYNAGADVHFEDSLGKLALTTEGIAQRDRFVLECCSDVMVPVACAIGGGYQPDHEALVERHVCLHRAAHDLMPRMQVSGRSSLTAGMSS